MPGKTRDSRLTALPLLVFASLGGRIHVRDVAIADVLQLATAVKVHLMIQSDIN